MDGKDFIQLKLDMDDDLVELADEISDRLYDILTRYQDSNTTGADIEVIGGIILQEFMANAGGLFQDRYYDLSDEVDEKEPITAGSGEDDSEDGKEEEESGSEVSDDITEIPDQ